MTALFTRVASRLAAREQGQTMAEYAVVLGLITVAIVAAIAFLGGNIQSTLTAVANRI